MRPLLSLPLKIREASNRPRVARAKDCHRYPHINETKKVPRTDWHEGLRGSAELGTSPPRPGKLTGCPAVRGTQLTEICVATGSRLTSVSVSTPLSSLACDDAWSISECSVKLRA